MRIKICGITQPEDARCAEEAGADAIGVVVFSGGISRRVVSAERAREIFDSVGPFTVTVAVSHTNSGRGYLNRCLPCTRMQSRSHTLSYSGRTGRRVIRVIGRGDPLPEDCDAVIVDDSHGKGRQYDPSYARAAVQRSRVPVILAGGLAAENMGDAIRQVTRTRWMWRAGLKSPGIKDQGKCGRLSLHAGVFEMIQKGRYGKYGGQYVSGDADERITRTRSSL